MFFFNMSSLSSGRQLISSFDRSVVNLFSGRLEGWCLHRLHQEILLLSTTQVSNDVQLDVRTLTINANAGFTAPIC